jgi:DNA-binding transcriptional LysR family regulator
MLNRIQCVPRGGRLDLGRINANLLVALDLLLTETSVTRAAERHGVTPSAMSHSLRALRDLLGDPILARAGGEMVPTPFAEKLRGPLHKALRDLERAVSGTLDFDPSTAQRGFILHAPDFISTLLLPALIRTLLDEAPRVDVEVRPVRRRGAQLEFVDAAALAEGDVDLVVAALVADVPGLCDEVLYAERFVCLAREGHPGVGEALDLETFVATPQVLITISDERSPSWVDHKLAEAGLSRRIAVRTRFFLSAALLVADSDLLLTCPYQLARHAAAGRPVPRGEPPRSPCRAIRNTCSGTRASTRIPPHAGCARPSVAPSRR